MAEPSSDTSDKISNNRPSIPTWKRLGFASAEDRLLSFWGDLSDLPVCRSALKELERRNAIFRKEAARNKRRTNRPNIIQTRSVVRGKDPRPQVDRVKKVKYFARRGGPDLSFVKERDPQPDSTASLKTKSVSIETGIGDKRAHLSNDGTAQPGKGRKFNTYDAAFLQHLNDHGIYHPFHVFADGSRTPRPSNFDKIRAVLAEIKPPLLSQNLRVDFKRVERITRDQYLSNTDRITKLLYRWLFRNNDLPPINNQFDNLDDLTELTSLPRPDYYEGADREVLDPGLREYLKGLIVPYKGERGFVAPNFFFEGKRPSASFAQIRQQALFEAALGARAMHALATYAHYYRGDGFNKKVASIAVVLTGDHLQIYGVYVGPPTEGGEGLTYYQCQFAHYEISDSVDELRKGVSALKNIREWAERKRDKLIYAANERYRLGTPEQSGESRGTGDSEESGPSGPSQSVSESEISGESGESEKSGQSDDSPGSRQSGASGESSDSKKTGQSHDSAESGQSEASGQSRKSSVSGDPTGSN